MGLALGGKAGVHLSQQLALAVSRNTLLRLLRRQPAVNYFAAESHLREYTRRELDRLVGGVAVVDQRATVGWSGGGVRRLLTLVTRTPPLRAFDRMLVVRLRSTT